MTTAEVLATIKDAVSKHQGNEYELYDALTDLGEEWLDHFDGLSEEEEDEGDFEDDDEL